MGDSRFILDDWSNIYTSTGTMAAWNEPTPVMTKPSGAAICVHLRGVLSDIIAQAERAQIEVPDGDKDGLGYWQLLIDQAKDAYDHFGRVGECGQKKDS